MTDTKRRRLLDALKRLDEVEKQRNMRRAEYEIALAALVEKEREHSLVEAFVFKTKTESES